MIQALSAYHIKSPRNLFSAAQCLERSEFSPADKAARQFLHALFANVIHLVRAKKTRLIETNTWKGGCLPECCRGGFASARSNCAINIHSMVDLRRHYDAKAPLFIKQAAKLALLPTGVANCSKFCHTAYFVKTEKMNGVCTNW